MLLSLAIRNIKRNRRRSVLTVIAMVMASSLLLLGMGIEDGKMYDMLASATEQYHGHLVISQTGYQAHQDMFIHFSPEVKLLKMVGEVPGVAGVSPRLRGFGLLSCGQETMPVEMLGVDPEKEDGVTTLQEKLIDGEGFDNDQGGVLLGRKLAQKLKVRPGDSLVLIGTGSDGSIANDLLTVKGIFSTGNTRNDTALVLVPLSWLQEFLVLQGEVHELAIRLDKPMRARTLVKTLGGLLPGKFEVQDWSVFLPEIQDAIALGHVSNMIIMVIFYLATGLSVFNTVYMSVMERSREFGILMALGTRPGQIRGMVLAETCVMGGISVLLGILLGFAMNLYMAKIGIDLSGVVAPITYAGGTILPVVHSVIEPVSQILSALVLFLVCIVAGFFPANKAANLTPIDVIRES